MDSSCSISVAQAASVNIPDQKSVTADKMTSRSTCLEEELICPVCDIFKHPVVLSCSHSFCKDCLQKWWTERPTQDCPVCKTISSSNHPPTNLEEKLRRTSLGGSEDLCAAHGEKLRLFCLDDKQLACLACRDSEKHTGHTFIPVGKASGRCKQKVQDLLKPLTDKLKVFDKEKTCFDQTEKHIMVQARNTETQIKKQFKELHRFLHEEEETRIAILRAEETLKSQEMKKRIEKLNRDMVTLSDAIRAVEDQLRADHVSFLQNYKTTKTMGRVHLTPPCTKPVSGALIDEAKHLGNLAFSVWYKMKVIVSYTPVILDPNTAPPRYSFSDDLTSVRYLKRENKLPLPDNPERFGYFCCALGSEGFNSGSHSWDVEVGDNKKWRLGVCAESFKRNGKQGGEYWNIDLYEGQHRVLSSGTALTVLPVKQKPRKIRVQLDWNGGELSFSDPDTNTHLHTFTHTFTERLFPFIRNVDGDDVKVLPGKICVTLENHS